MKKRCLLLLSLFLATLTGAWAQTVTISAVTNTGCQVASPSRNMQFTFSSVGAGAALTAYRAAVLSSTNVLLGSTTIPTIVNGVNPNVTVTVNNTDVAPNNAAIGTGNIAAIQSSTDGVTWTNVNNTFGPFDILIRPVINPNPNGITAPNVCEGSVIPVTINGSNLDLYAPYTVTYQFLIGIFPQANQTATATWNGTNLVFTTSPSYIGVTGIRLSAISTAVPNSCVPTIPGIGYVDAAFAVSQLPTISGATPAATPVCAGQPVPIILNGLLPSTFGTPNIGQQTITYSINGGPDITSRPPFTVVCNTHTILIPDVPAQLGPPSTVVIKAISSVGPACPRLTPPLPITVTPYFNVVNPGSIDVNGTGAVEQTVCENAPFALLKSVTPGTGTPTVGASVAVITYDWEYAAAGTACTATAPGWISIGVNAPDYQPVPNTGDYVLRRKTISTLDGVPCVAYSNCINDIVNNITVGTIGTIAPIICEGQTTFIGTITTPAVVDGTLSYQWQSNTTGCADPFTDVVGGTDPTAVTYTTAALTQDTWYQRIDKSLLNGVPCFKITNCIQVTVNNLTPGTVGADQTICEGITPAPLTETAAATGDGTLTYRWESSTDATSCADGTWGVVQAASAVTGYAPGALTVDTYFRRITISTLGGVPCEKTSPCVKVTVNNLTAGAVGAYQTICENATPAPLTETTASTGDGALTYRWESSTDATSCATGTWATATGVSDGTGYAPGALLVDTYYRRVTISTLNAVPCEKIAPCVKITVNNLTPGSIAANQLICAFGDPAAFTSVAATGDGAITYRWQSSTVSCAAATDNGITTETYDVPAGLAFTTYYQRVAVSTLNGVPCEKTSNCIIVTVESGVAAPTGGPTFTPATACQTLPGGTQAVTNNMNCAVGTAAVWYTADYPAAPPANWANGGNAPTTLPTDVVGVQTFYVACKQINPPYCESITRTPITFEVLPAPNGGLAPGIITLTPPSICEGATPVPLSSDAAAVCGAGFTPVWYAAATGATLKPLPAMTPNSPAGNYDYWVACKNDVTGCESLIRRRVRFVVNPAPPAPFLIPLASDPTPTFYPSQACQGPVGSTVALNPVDIIAIPNTVPFNITCGGGRTLKWYLNDGTTLFNGGVSPTSLPTDVPGVQTYQVSCIQNSTGCESLTKTSISFTVNPAPAPPTDPIMLSPMTACFDTPAGAVMTNTATCQGVGGPANPIWYTFDGVTETALPGAPAVTPAVTTVYHVYCKNVNTNCVSLTFTAVTFTKFPTPTIDAIVPATAKYCNGATTMAVALSGTPATAIAPNSAVKFKYTGGASIGLANGTTSTALPSFTAVNAGNAPVVVPIIITPYTFGPNGMDDSGTGDDCIGAPFTYTITVNPTPTVNAIPSQVICNNTNNTAVTFGSPVAGTTYKYTVAYSGASMGTPFVDTDPATGVPSLTLTNASASQLAIATITVTPTFDGCTGPTTSFTITVMPALTTNLQASQTDVCPNTEVTLNPNCSTVYPGSPFTTTVQWTTSDPTSPAGPTVTPNAPDLTYTYTAKCIATYMGTTCESALSSSVSVRTHRLLVDIIAVNHPGGDVNQPGAKVEVRNDLGNDLSVPKNTIVNDDFIRTWNILARPCYSPVGSISFEFLGGPLPLNYKTVDNFAPHAFFANDGANAFYSQASATYGPGGILPFYTGGTSNFPNGTYTVLVQGRTNAVPGAIPAARNKMSGGALLSTRTVTFKVLGMTSGARVGVEETVDAENWISLIQNPISEEIMLRLSGKVGDDIKLNLVNLQGQEVHQSSVKLESSSELNTINARNFNTGFYILKAVNGDKVKTIKVLKVQ